MFIEPPGSPLLELIEPFFEKRILTPLEKAGNSLSKKRSLRLKLTAMQEPYDSSFKALRHGQDQN
jgi:hypothetical protein